jgi:hypothetical protein
MAAGPVVKAEIGRPDKHYVTKTPGFSAPGLAAPPHQRSQPRPPGDGQRDTPNGSKADYPIEILGVLR